MATPFGTDGTSFVLPPLPYPYDALEPSISKEIMTLHHDGHHQTYVTNLNAAFQKLTSSASSLDIRSQIELQSAIKFNGGGHINHSLFWKNLAPSKENGGKLDPSSVLAKQINTDFGSLETLKTRTNAKALTIQGSGWVWIVYNTQTSHLEIITTKDQDPVIAPQVPLIGIDMWEHAFYLQYQTKKAEYLKNIWAVINFDEANKRFVEASKKPQSKV